MNKRFEYLEKIKNSRVKAITISIEEAIIEDIERIAEELQVSRNRIISEALEKLSNDYEKFDSPYYYIINASPNNIDIVNGHLHMLKGNKVSVWEEDSKFNEIEVGDYVFVWLQDYGIVGAGEVVSEKSHSTFSIVEHYVDGEREETRFEPTEEWYVNVAFDKKALVANTDELGLDKAMSLEELDGFIEHLRENSNEKFKKHKYFERYSKFIRDDLEQGVAVINSLPLYIGRELKKEYLG